MPDRRRLLVALVVRGAVAHEIDGLRRALGSRELERIPPHVTLLAPRNVAASVTPELARHLRGVAASFPPLRLTLGPPEHFRSPRAVSYLAVTAEPDELTALVGALARGPLAAPAGRAVRPFVAHLTLRSGADEERTAQAVTLLEGYRVTVQVATLSLLEQEVGVAGHPWREVDELTLGRPARTGEGGRALEFHLSSQLPGDLPFPPPVARAGRELPAPAAPIVLSVSERGATVAAAAGVLAERALVLSWIEVLEGERGLGIGSQLLAFAERLARERELEGLAILDGRAPEFLARRGYRRGALGLYLRP